MSGQPGPESLANLRLAVFVLTFGALVSSGRLTHGASQSDVKTAEYTIAFANLGPLNTDVFLADADGRNARPIASSPEHDYNASFSRDGQWIIFTSDRSGSSDIYRARLDGTGLERLTTDPAFDDQASLSPDGTLLAFVSTRSGRANVWILDMRTRRARNLTAGHVRGDFRPAWSPDGRWIAFSSQRDSRKPSATRVPDNDIYIIHPDGSGLRRLASGQTFAGSPSWSADGSRLVFYQGSIDEVMRIRDARELRGTTQIVSVDIVSGQQRVLTTGEGEKWSPCILEDDRVAYASGGPTGGIEFVGGNCGARGEFGSPEWSPDGRRMLFHRDVESRWPPFLEWRSRDPRFRLIRTGVFPTWAPGGDQLAVVTGNGSSLHNGLVRMDRTGSARSVLFDDPERNALAPAFSPDGRTIAFGIGTFFQATFGQPMPAAPRHADIAIINSDGTGFKLVTHGDGNYGFPSWSPNGRRFVVRALTATGKGLAIVDARSGDRTWLTTGPNDTVPAWSPRGDVIAFSSDRDDGDFDIYTIRVDGTGLGRLTDTPGNDAHCAWSPDGQWLVFSSARGGYKDEAALHPHNPQPYGDLYVMRPDGSDVRQLTDDQYEDGTVTFVPTRPNEDNRSVGAHSVILAVHGAPATFRMEEAEHSSSRACALRRVGQSGSARFRKRGA